MRRGRERERECQTRCVSEYTPVRERGRGKERNKRELEMRQQG